MAGSKSSSFLFSGPSTWTVWPRCGVGFPISNDVSKKILTGMAVWLGSVDSSQFDKTSTGSHKCVPHHFPLCCVSIYSWPWYLPKGLPFPLLLYLLAGGLPVLLRRPYLASLYWFTHLPLHPDDLPLGLCILVPTCEPRQGYPQPSLTSGLCCQMPLYRLALWEQGSRCFSF